MQRKHKQLLIGVVISAVFLWLAFRRVPLSELWAFLKTINYLWTLPLVVILIGSMYWRSVRWRLLLPPTRNIPPPRLFGPLIIGFGLNNVFPARAGEVLRPLALTKKEGVPFGEGMGTVVMERIFDSIMLLVLFFVVLVFVPFEGITQTWDARRNVPGGPLNYALAAGFLVLAGTAAWGWRWSRRQNPTGENAPVAKGTGRIWTLLIAGFVLACIEVVLLHPFESGRIYTFGKEYVLSGEAVKSLTQKTAIIVAFLMAGVIAILFRPVRDLVLRIVNWMRFLPAGWRRVIVRLIETFAGGLDSLKSPARVFWILVHSVGVWVSVALAFWITSFGIPGLRLTIMEAHAYLVLTCVAIMIPAAPGYWGLYEVGGVFALLVMDVTEDASAALGFTLVVHFAQWLPITLLGLYYAAKIHVSPGEAQLPEAGAVEADEGNAAGGRERMQGTKGT